MKRDLRAPDPEIQTVAQRHTKRRRTEGPQIKVKLDAREVKKSKIPWQIRETMVQRKVTREPETKTQDIRDDSHLRVGDMMP